MLRDSTEIARVERTRRDFIANVSHELRTPLTSLLGYTETLLDESADAKSREFLEIIRRNAQRMSRLTEDLLTLARVESGEDRLQPAAVAGHELLRDAQVSFSEIARSRGLVIEIADSPDVEVFADRDSIHQVFANLIDNAVEAMEGSLLRELHISTSLVESRDSVEVIVADTGHGVTSEMKEKLFLPYFSTKKRGTGLGLPIVSRIVHEHNGNIRVEENEPMGSRFIVELPIAIE